MMVRHRSIQAEVPDKVMKPHAQRRRAAAAHPAVTPSRERGCAPSSPPFPPEEVGTKPAASLLSTPGRQGLSLPVGLPSLPLSVQHGTQRAEQGLSCAASCSPWKHTEMCYSHSVYLLTLLVFFAIFCTYFLKPLSGCLQINTISKLWKTCS